MEAVRGREERKEGERDLEERIREAGKENEGLGKIADLLRHLLQASKEDKEELQRLRRIQEDIKSKDEISEEKLQAKLQKFGQEQSRLLNKNKTLQKELDLLKERQKSKLETANQQIETYKRKLEELTQQNLSNQQKLENTIIEMSQNQKTAKQNWIAEYEKLQMSHNSLISQHQEAMKEMETYKIRVSAEQRQANSKHQRERKLTMAEFQKERQEHRKQLMQEQKNRQRSDAVIKQLQATTSAQRETIEDLTAQNLKNTQAHQQILNQMQTLKDQCQQKILSETARLNKEFQAKIQAINQENRKTMSQINNGFDQAIEKQKMIHLKEVDKLRGEVRALREANQSNVQSSSDELAKLKSSFATERQELTDMLNSIYSVVFGRPLEVVENKQITKLVQQKFNDLTSKLIGLQEALEQSKKQCKTQQSQLSQLKKFLNIFSLKLNNPEILNALDKLDTLKASNFMFGQQDLMECVNILTKRLILRLKQCKEEADNLQREKGELIGQQFESGRKEAQLQKTIELIEGRLKKEEEHAKELIDGYKEKEGRYMAEKLALEKRISSLNNQADNLSKEIYSLRGQVDDLSGKISKQSNEIFSLSQQNAALKDHLAFQASKNQQNVQEIGSLQQQNENLSKENIQLLESSEALSAQIQTLKSAMSSQEQQSEAWKRRQIDQINAFIEKQYDSRGQLDSFDAFLDFLKDNQTSSEVIPFTVSHIFQRAVKERQILITQANKFLNISLSSSTLLYRYDQCNKNFSNYLPIKQNFHFVILGKTKKLTIFGVLSTGLGKGSRTIAFNLTEPKFFESNPNNVSSSYDGGYLIFGQREIIFRNNSTLQIVINSRIFGARHFTFKKAELVGKDQESDSVQLQALQIHRLNY